ncbi:MFS transporter [Nonomuraea mangrovi]|uniref:MFS transporter n=1 Tax=Nonomuraea mangrovi TaxID=2316207 RepID=A0ABW4SPY3_9ACTN
MILPERGPVRSLAFSVLLRATGRGLFITVSVIFFLSSVGLSATQVGAGMTIAGVVSLAAGLPSGRLCDVLGPRAVSITFAAFGGLAILGYAFVDSFWGFAVVAALAKFADAGDSVARATLVGGIAPPGERVRVRAYIRAVTNVGWSIGGLAAGVALAVDTRPAYLTMVYGCAACYLGAGALTLRVPRVAPAPHTAGGGPTWIVLRDRPYVVLALLNMVLVMHLSLLTTIIPMWIKHIGAPGVMVAAIGLINTITVTLLQVRLSRGTGEIAGAARAQRRAGALLLLACVLFAIAAGQPLWAMLAALVGGALLHVFGELLQSAGSWGLSYELAPSHALGQYQGLYNTGWQAAEVVAPVLLTTVVIGWGWPGWLLVGALFLGAGLAVPPAARWAARSRSAYGDAQVGLVVGRTAVTEA